MGFIVTQWILVVARIHVCLKSNETRLTVLTTSKISIASLCYHYIRSHWSIRNVAFQLFLTNEYLLTGLSLQSLGPCCAAVNTEKRPDHKNEHGTEN